MNWYFEREGVSSGPVDEGDLILMIRRREVPRDSMIWHPGLDEWLPIAELKPEWLVVPAIGSGGVASKESSPEPKARPRPPAVLDRSPVPPETEEPVESKPSAAPRPSQVRTILPPAAKATPQADPAPPAQAAPPTAEEPRPSVEKKGFLKKLFGRGKNA